MLYRLTQFAGEIPRRDPDLLPKGAAEVAENCDFASGALRSMYSSAAATILGSAADDFIAYDGAWFAYDDHTTYAPGPVDDNRLYITTVGKSPKLREVDSATVHDLAIPTPTAAPLVTVNTEPVDDPDDPLPVETVLFATTWVTDLDEESLPSPTSEPLDILEGTTLNVSIVDNAAPSGTRVNRIRVYRSATSATGTTGLYFVKELSVGTPLYVHDIETDPTQELIPSADYDPPVATLEGIVPMPNGMMAAFSGRSLYFCEPYIPHAWPRKYALRTEYDIVGLGVSGNFLIIMTEGTPYIAQGSHPDNVILERLDVNLPCLSKRGIVDMGLGVAYPSHDGLVLVSGPNPQVITRDIFDRREWRALKPETFRAGFYDGRYVFSYTPGATRITSMIDLTGEIPGFVRTDVAATSFAYDLVSGKLFYSDGTTAIREYASLSAAPADLEWKSNVIHLPVPQSFGVVRVDGEQLAPGSSFSMTIYADGAARTTITSLNQIERLASGYAEKWQIEITGAVKVTRVSLAGGPSELMGAG
ncbi:MULTISPECIES: hypothetical protein [unclassified Mameliella]|uniref:hypothetical protein n=1 Tax=Mameliella sp. LZ-28 TaxID=2484146 RepID=UPI00143F2376|nr:hypothetical protein [Mameliella sp. LZ-28]MCR9276252.1 hypothetical protein [Paracoccaceae bacterium]